MVEPVKRTSSMRDNGGNLATVLMLLQLCTTYPVTSKQLEAKLEHGYVNLLTASFKTEFFSSS